MHEMIFGHIRLPTNLHQTFNTLFLFRNEVDHTTLIMPNEGDITNFPNGYCIRYIKFAVTQIGTTGSYNVCKFFGNVQMLAIVHAHTYQNLSTGIFPVFTKKVLVPDKITNGGAPCTVEGCPLQNLFYAAYSSRTKINNKRRNKFLVYPEHVFAHNFHLFFKLFRLTIR